MPEGRVMCIGATVADPSATGQASRRRVRSSPSTTITMTQAKKYSPPPTRPKRVRIRVDEGHVEPRRVGQEAHRPLGAGDARAARRSGPRRSAATAAGGRSSPRCCARAGRARSRAGSARRPAGRRRPAPAPAPSSSDDGSSAMAPPTQPRHDDDRHRDDEGDGHLDDRLGQQRAPAVGHRGERRADRAVAELVGDADAGDDAEQHRRHDRRAGDDARPGRSASMSSANSAVSTVTTTREQRRRRSARTHVTVIVDTLIHSLRMASITIRPPAAGARRNGDRTAAAAADGTTGPPLPPERYSCDCAVASRKASSSEALCGDSSWSTAPTLAASSPTRSIARPWTSMPSGPAGSYVAPARRRCSANTAGCGVRTRTHRVGVAVDELADRALLDQPAPPDDDEVVGHQRDLRQQVAADEHRAALAGEVDEDVADPADALGVEPVGRLVEDHRVRVAEQHAGEPEPLAHAERVAADLALGDLGQPDERRAPRRPGRCGTPLLAASQRRWLRPERAGWTYPASSSAPISYSGRRNDSKRLAVERRRAALGPVEAEHAAHRRALARPVRAEEAGDPARVDVEAQVVDGDDAAEPLGQVADLDHRSVRARRATPRRRRRAPRRRPRP